MSEYVDDIREFRRTKLESKASWLDWRKGKFSKDEITLIQRGLEVWLHQCCAENGFTKDEALSKLKWARDNKLSVWCDIAHFCALPKRKIGSIRHCILRNFLAGSEMSRWSKEQTAEFKRLQSIYGPRAWKDIASETGRTLEDVVNKGRQLASVAKSKSAKAVRFSRVDVARLKIQKLLRNDAEANPYELQAIRPDCKLVSLIRKYHFPSGDIDDVYYIPASKIARKLHSAQTVVRSRWHRDILRCVVNRVSTKLGDHELMDSYLVLRAHRACRGKLTDIHGNTVHTAYDWDSLNLQAIAPVWPHELTKNRLTSLLKAHPKYNLWPLPQVIESVRDSLLSSYSRDQIFEAASNHLTEFRRLINIIADRGDRYFEEDRIQAQTISEIVVSD
jgi:hypothetical protein